MRRAGAGIVLTVCVCTVAEEEARFLDDVGGSSRDGRSWETAFKKTQEGIDAASTGDTVIIAEGDLRR